jgi:DNA (cytosine-5)-methyltransferase 1
LRAIELFAGAGGLGIGVSRAGFTPIRVVERDRWCCDTLRENRNRGSGPLAHWPVPDESDVRVLDFRDLEGRVDLVSGGPPCQPFSLGGKHAGRGDHRDMWEQAVRVVRETRPRAFLFENVKGLLRPSFGAYFQHVRRQLGHPDLARGEDEGWMDHRGRLERHATAKGTQPAYVVTHALLNAANFGVPQKRERVFLVGFRADLTVDWAFPPPTHSEDALLWSQVHETAYWERHGVPRAQRHLPDRVRLRAERLTEDPGGQPWRTVRDALAGLPDPETAPDVASTIPDHRHQPGARAYAGHTGSPLDRPAKTLKAGVHGVPGGENMLVRPDGRVRYFTVRESARLQTFPDDHRFHGAWSECMRQLGNAVPALLAESVARAVAQRLESK